MPLNSLADGDLLESKLPQEALIELFRNFPEATFHIDAQRRIVAYNGAAQRLFGFDASELLGQSTRVLYADTDDFEQLGHDRYGQQAQPVADVYDVLYRRKDGVPFWGATHGRVLRSPEGVLLGFFGTIRDVSAAKRQEERARFLTRLGGMMESLDPAQLLEDVAQLTVPILADWCTIDLLDEQGQLTRAAVGHAEPEARQQAMEWWSRFPARDGDSFVHELQRTRVSSGVVELTEQLLEANPDRELVALLRQLSIKQALVVPIVSRTRFLGALTLLSTNQQRRLHPEDQQVCELLGQRIGLALENAQLYQTERAARLRIARLQQLTASLSTVSTLEEVAQVVCQTGAEASEARTGALWSLEQGGGLVLRGSFGYPTPYIDRFRYIAPDSSLPAVATIRTGLAVYVECEQDFERRVPEAAPAAREQGMFGSYVAIPLRGMGGVIGLLAFSYHGFRRFSAEDRLFLEALAGHCGPSIERAQLNDERQEASRIKDEFLATVSHELRTPLNAILGWSTILLQEAGNPGAILRGAEVIRRNAQSLARLVEDILDVSRIITGKLNIEPRPVDLESVVEQALEVVRPSAQAKALRIVLTPAEQPVLLVADAQRLQQVLWNLFSNAIKFTEPGGELRIALVQEQASVRIVVSDTGHGIAADMLPLVFNRFHQVDSSTTRRFGGLGLGLAIVRHIVELHGGTVVAESEGLGCGSTFTVTLPLRVTPAAREASSGSAVEPTAPLYDLSGLRVLIVDDDPDERELLFVTLTRAGASVESAGSTGEALHALTRFAPHVLVSDIGMPGEDGYELLRRVRALPPPEGGELPAIALTAHSRAEDRSQALAVGFATHLSKPVQPNDLLASVANLAQLRTH